MYVAIWRFVPRPEKVNEFENAYAAGGVWAKLFQKGGGYLGTQLLKPIDGKDAYLTVDRWDSREAFEAFKKKWKSEYETLDRQLEGLTLSEESLGIFTDFNAL